MADEKELLALAEGVVEEVLGRIRPDTRWIVAGPVLDRPGWDRPAPLHELASRYAREPSEPTWEAIALRCFLAHDVAMALGSRACPLPEELARPCYEGMEPDADRWRAEGVFRERLPLPPGHVSLRDQFLLLAGRDPHPFLD